MEACPVRSTIHFIGEQTVSFTVLAPTNADPVTREVTVTDTGGHTAALRFEHDDFQLFKSILNEY